MPSLVELQSREQQQIGSISLELGRHKVLAEEAFFRGLSLRRRGTHYYARILGIFLKDGAQQIESCFSTMVCDHYFKKNSNHSVTCYVGVCSIE
jgi:hypothetical protein